MLVIQPDVPGLEWAICSQEGTFGTKQRLSEQEMMYGHPTWLSLPPLCGCLTPQAAQPCEERESEQSFLPLGVRG